MLLFLFGFSPKKNGYLTSPEKVDESLFIILTKSALLIIL